MGGLHIGKIYIIEVKLLKSSVNLPHNPSEVP
jgi:hypothetical protein